MARRVKLKRTKGWQKPEGTVVVSRPGRWGNPIEVGGVRCLSTESTFVEEPVRDRATAVRFFREMLAYQIRPYPSERETTEHLRGKDLAC
ncbi:DUF4326 domain-containing protein [Paroceanicella profunda]|uniref:DUF4326 domain-containing protein n=1 Tax=Paroceanicella profunda TaxID=2579971 RepID=UPI0014793933|nr:DUF4326 domain-containing protein [Paroceanicella profunda]